MSNPNPRGITLAGNWKMNSGIADTRSFFKSLGADIPKEIRIILFPPTTSLQAALESTQGSSIAIGAQNAHWEAKGAFTGEISGTFLKELNIKNVLVGHSERRQHFGETNETAAKRTAALLKQGFHVIFCCGETQAERESNQTHAILEAQLSPLLAKDSSHAVAKFFDGRLTIAYEPVWAIGTGLTATPEQAEEAHQFIRKYIWDHASMEASGKTSILYGGSVKPDNIQALLACPNVDGGLVGGASVKADSFRALIKNSL